MLSFIKGFLDCFSGFGLLLKPGIKRFVLIPFIINLGLFYLAALLLNEQVNRWMEEIPSWLSFLEWLIWPLFAIAMFYTFTILANLIAAPFNSLLSARIEAKLTGKKPEDINSDSFARLMIRTTKSEIQKILYAIKWLLILLLITVIITFIPVVNITVPFIWVIFSAWFFALEYNDYPLANRGHYFTEVQSHNRNNRMRSLGLGSAVFVLTSIPVINFFAMPVAVAGATKSITKIITKTNQDIQ